MSVTVLVVDDVPTLAQTFARLLGRVDQFKVVACCHDGDEAIAFARRERPDLVVMDVKMPRVDGIEATKEIKQMLPETVVVLLSAYGDPALVNEATLAGASAYLTKGTKPSKLLESIREAALPLLMTDAAETALIRADPAVTAA